MSGAAPPGGGIHGRSAWRETRNPVLALPSARRIRELPPELRHPLGDLLRELATDADSRAHEAWRKRKGVMAVYWRAVSTYAKHVARAVDPRR